MKRNPLLFAAILCGALLACESEPSPGLEEANCENGKKDGDETGVDCGGKCAPCVSEDPCTNGEKDSEETDVDCGGSTCERCNADRLCETASDCQAGMVCEEAYNCYPFCNHKTICKTVPETCSPGACDSAHYRHEACEPLGQPGEKCADLGNGLGVQTCVDGYTCSDDKCVAIACNNNGVRDGTESGIDCGASCGIECATFSTCRSDFDCVEGSGCQSGPCHRTCHNSELCMPLKPNCDAGACAAGQDCQTVYVWTDPVYYCSPAQCDSSTMCGD